MKESVLVAAEQARKMLRMTKMNASHMLRHVLEGKGNSIKQASRFRM